MCRLLGFASDAPACLDWALLGAENSLERQSTRNADGWGLGFYVDGRPHVRRRTRPAFADATYGRITQSFRSTHVIAHVRKGTVGTTSIRNNHPFRRGRWLFAHNGTVEAFDGRRGTLLDRVSPRLRDRIRGDTDSEVLFHLILTELQQAEGTLDASITAAASAVHETVALVADLDERDGTPKPSSLNLLLTDGSGFVAVRRGRELHLHHRNGGRAHPAEAWETSTGGLLAVPAQASGTRTVLLASERLSPTLRWTEVPDGSLVTVDASLRTRIAPLAIPA